MKEVDPQELMQVIGGARSVAGGGSRRDLENQMLFMKLSSDMKDAIRPQQNQNAAMMMAMAVIASRRFA
jgi:hypothetical protein